MHSCFLPSQICFHLFGFSLGIKETMGRGGFCSPPPLSAPPPPHHWPAVQLPWGRVPKLFWARKRPRHMGAFRMYLETDILSFGMTSPGQESESPLPMWTQVLNQPQGGRPGCAASLEDFWKGLEEFPWKKLTFYI